MLRTQLCYEKAVIMKERSATFLANKMNPVGKAPKSARAHVPRLLYARGFEETFP